MSSGIPEKHLTSLGIPTIQNLPAKKYLRDHSVCILVLSSRVSGVEDLEDSITDFLVGENPLTRSFSFDTVGWFKTLEQTSNFSDGFFH